MINNECLSSQNIFLGDLLLDGNKIQNWKEMDEVLSTIDLVDTFKDVELGNYFPSGKVLSFNNVESSRAFILAVGVEGSKRNLFEITPSTYFDNGLLTERRIDSGQFFVYEKKSLFRKGKIDTLMGVRYGDDGLIDKYSSLVRDVISQYMPHLSDDIKNLKLTAGTFSFD